MLTALWHIWLELSPWLLLGAIAGGAMHALLPEGWLQKHLTGRLGVLKAVLLGIPLPLCSCGVIPVGLGLRKNGASNGAAVGFLISTPQTGVDSILVSGSFLGWPFAALKVMIALVTGTIGGLLADRVGQTTAAMDEERVAHSSTGSRFERGLEHALELIRSIWGWLVIGVVISAAISHFVPAGSLSDMTAFSGVWSLLIALTISVPLYVCATASVPIAASLVAGGLPPGAALVFLMAGPATNVATLGAVYRALGGRSLAVYLSTIIAGSLAAGWWFNQTLSVQGIAAAHNHGATWWQIVCGGVLFLMILKFAIDDLRRTLRASSSPSADAVTLQVTGMTCDGCAARLERTLEAHPEIDHAVVSYADGTAVVSGTATSETIADTVVDAGFQTASTIDS